MIASRASARLQGTLLLLQFFDTLAFVGHLDPHDPCLSIRAAHLLDPVIDRTEIYLVGSRCFENSIPT